MNEIDCLIINGMVLPFDDHGQWIPEGYVAIQEGSITDVGPMSGKPEIRAAEMIDATGCLVMPGLVNTHAHMAMTLFRGLADDLPLMTWLTEHIFPAEATHVNEELVYWGGKLAAAEMLLSGTTTVADGYFLEDHTARAVTEAGMRAVLGQGVIDFPAPGVPDPALNIETARRFVELWYESGSLIRPSIFCHSPYTCSPETLRKGKDLARELGVFFQIHVAETASEVEQVEGERGLRPVFYLDSLGLLDDATLAVHCVHVNDREIDLLAERQTPVSICVESQMKLSSGRAPVAQMLEQGVKVSLGTDGAASNNDLNMFGEIRSLALLAKVVNHNPTVLPAVQTLELATRGGAEALGWGGLIGRITPGRRADLVILELKPPGLTPLYNPHSHLVYAATGREVKTVMVDGRILVRDKEFIAFDLEETMSNIRRIAARIRK